MPSVWLVLLSLLALVCSSSQAAAELRLSNSHVTATFSPTLGSLSSFQLLPSFPGPFRILTDTTLITVNDSIPVKCASLLSTLSDATSVTFSFQCPPSLPYQLSAVYSLQADWTFVRKQVFLFNTSSDTQGHLVTNVTQLLALDAAAVAETGIIHNTAWQPNKDHVIFIRSAVTAGAPALFAAFQSPFAWFQTASQSSSADAALLVTGTYSVGLPTVNVYGEPFSTDGFILGGYVLDEHWHINPPPSASSLSGLADERDYSLNYAERAAFSDAVQMFWVGPPRVAPVRMAVGWDSNDFQLDIATPHGVAAYQRILDRCGQLGINHIIFAPQNTGVSSRYNATDGWGWEEGLWLTLGEHLRAGQWVPGRDAVPASIQYLLDYAASRNVKLMAYVYPPLGFRAEGDGAWLFGGDCCATLASVEFQHYLAETMIAFARVTGLGGFSFDYNGYGDPDHSTYAQWRGWHWILRQLRDNLPDIVMDHRQIMHAEGPWSWLTGSYAEPLQGDENPESYGVLIPSLHTDHCAANVLRAVNYNYRLYQLAPYVLMPGFIGHQTERSWDNLTLAWGDNYIRDFDVLGFPYSLLSTIASAGLNQVHTMLPARDLSEFSLLPATLLEFWQAWLQWPTEHRAELEYAVPILADPGVGRVDGWVTMDAAQLQGHFFLFNPNYPQQQVALVMDSRHLLPPPSPSSSSQSDASAQGMWLLTEQYPRQATVTVFKYGETVNVRLDGDSATVYEVRFVSWGDVMPGQPLLVGASGRAEMVTEDTLRIAGVLGEPGTSSAEVSLWFSSEDEARAVTTVLVNGAAVAFTSSSNRLTLSSPLSFPGQYLPRAASLGPVPADFTGGNYSTVVKVSQLLLDQLAARALSYPIAWTEEELTVGWLAPHRLLLFAAIMEPNDKWNMTAALDSMPLVVTKAYTSRHPVWWCFQGFFIDVTDLVTEADREYALELVVPTVEQGQFQGVFLENIEVMLVEAQAPSDRASSSVRAE